MCKDSRNATALCVPRVAHHCALLSDHSDANTLLAVWFCSGFYCKANCKLVLQLLSEAAGNMAGLQMGNIEACQQFSRQLLLPPTMSKCPTVSNSVQQCPAPVLSHSVRPVAPRQASASCCLFISTMKFPPKHCQCTTEGLQLHTRDLLFVSQYQMLKRHLESPWISEKCYTSHKLNSLEVPWSRVQQSKLLESPWIPEEATGTSVELSQYRGTSEYSH